MSRSVLLFVVALSLAAHFSPNASAEKKENPKPTAVPAPALKGAGAVDLEDLLSKNPFPADAKGQFHFAPVFAKPPKSGQEYTFGGLHVRGEMPLHKHKLRSEIVYVLAGTGSFFLGKETIALKPGLIIHIPVGIPHGFKLDGDGRVLLVAVGRYGGKDFHPVKVGATAVKKSKKNPRSGGGAGNKSIGGGGGPTDVVTPSTRD